MKTTPGKSPSGAFQIGFTSFLAYTACYIGKNILSAVMPQLLETSSLGSDALGMMGSIFLLTYGIGQFINGMIGNRVRPKYMVLVGLFLPGLTVGLFPFCSSPAIGILLWAVCGFFSSMLWGPLTRMIGENTDPKTGSLLMSFLSVASVMGNFLAYALALLSAGSGNMLLAFLIGGGWMIFTAAVWVLSCAHMERKGFIKSPLKNQENAKAGAWAFLTLFRQPVFVLMLLATMLNGIIRNAVAFWIPTFLSQHLLIPTKWVSAVAVILPLVNILGVFLTQKGFNRFKNEKWMCLILFALSAVLLVPVALCPPDLAILSVIALFTASAAMTAACNMIFSVYVLRFRESGMISGITGFLDCSAYLAAFAASLLFTAMAGNGNWGPVILIWIAITALGALASALANKLEPQKKAY